MPDHPRDEAEVLAESSTVLGQPKLVDHDHAGPQGPVASPPRRDADNPQAHAQETLAFEYDGDPPTDSTYEEDLGADQEKLIGQVVADRYRVLEMLGYGGMGTVYLAEHVTIEKKVALKVLLPEFAGRSDLRERFLQEARAAARIGHENIVDITDFGTTPDGSAFFAMEYLDGQDLSRIIGREGPLSRIRAKPILLRICRALAAAHGHGVIHRDMKPENIFLVEREGKKDFVKILDFGIAKVSAEEQQQHLTRTGMLIGTPDYMSPEQAQGKELDHRVDIYAVGIIMYEMLTGVVPFRGKTFMDTLSKHMFEQPPPPTQMNPDASFPPEAESIIFTALAKDPAQRMPTMKEMERAISKVVGKDTRPQVERPEAMAALLETADIPSELHSPDSVVASQEDDLPDELLLPAASGRGRNLVLALAVVLLLGAVALAVTLKRSSPPPVAPAKAAPSHKPANPRVAQPPKPAVPRQVTIQLESRPAGAGVYSGQQAMGKTPAKLRLKHGKDKVSLSLRLPGFHQEVLELIPDRDQNHLVELRAPDASLKRAKHKPRSRSMRKRAHRSAPPKPQPPPTPQSKKPDAGRARLNSLINPFK